LDPHETLLNRDFTGLLHGIRVARYGIMFAEDCTPFAFSQRGVVTVGPYYLEP
jgi:hypothetical protein